MYQYPSGGQPPIYNSNYYPQTMLLHHEKAAIRKAAIYCGIPMIITALIMDLWFYPYLIVLQFFGIDQQKAIEIASEPAVSAVMGIIISAFTFIVPFSIVYLVSGKKFSAVIPPFAPQKGLWAPFLLIGLGFCAFSNIGTNILSQFFESLGFEYNLSMGEDPKGIFGFFLAVISTAIVPALVEEYACRGVLHSILSRFGEGFSIFITALLFGVMHGNFRQIPFAFVLGLYFGYVRVKTGTLWICVVLHFINNFVSTLLSWLPDTLSVAEQNVIYVIYLAVSLICAVIGIVMLKKFDTDFFKLKKPQSICTEGQKYKWFFSSAFTIIFLVLNILGAISYIG